MPLPSQSRNQRWTSGQVGRHIPAPSKYPSTASDDFLEKRHLILARDGYLCHVCGKNGLLIDLTVDKCICRRCIATLR